MYKIDKCRIARNPFHLILTTELLLKAGMVIRKIQSLEN
jgi:hypothetical protein